MPFIERRKPGKAAPGGVELLICTHFPGKILPKMVGPYFLFLSLSTLFSGALLMTGIRLSGRALIDEGDGR